MCPVRDVTYVSGRSQGVKALAVAAQRCFADYRPGGMRVIAGSVILEDTGSRNSCPASPPD